MSALTVQQLIHVHSRRWMDDEAEPPDEDHEFGWFK